MLDHKEIHRHFKRADPDMAEVIKRVGPFTLRPQPDRFKLLVRSIISQQISVAAARTIRGRLERAAELSKCHLCARQASSPRDGIILVFA